MNTKTIYQKKSKMAKSRKIQPKPTKRKTIVARIKQSKKNLAVISKLMKELNREI